MVLPRTILRAFATATQSVRTVGATVRRPAGQLGRRAYATEQRHEVHKSSDIPWIIASVGIGAPTAAYLVSTGPEKKVHYDHVRPEVKEAEDEKREAIAKGEPVPEDGYKGRPSDIDQPQATKYPEGPSTMSGKQAGLDNDNSSNPYITAPGKSVKGEGDTDTTKLRGTVDEKRHPA